MFAYLFLNVMWFSYKKARSLIWSFLTISLCAIIWKETNTFILSIEKVFCSRWYINQKQCVVSPTFLELSITDKEQYVVCPTFCRTIDILVKTSVLLVLHFCRTIDTLVKTTVLLVRGSLELSIHQSKSLHQYSSLHQK